jgi:hypothetical protein
VPATSENGTTSPIRDRSVLFRLEDTSGEVQVGGGGEERERQQGQRGAVSRAAGAR